MRNMSWISTGAIPEPSDPEVITVPHLQSGERLRLRKGFAGARILDLENKVVDHLPPINENNYDISKAVIDEDDVGIATLTSFRGDKIKVRRQFFGAKIIDLEAKVANENSHLIGQKVKSEREF